MVEISGNKAKAGRRERERETEAKEEREPTIPRGREESFLFPFFEDGEKKRERDTHGR